MSASIGHASPRLLPDAERKKVIAHFEEILASQAFAAVGVATSATRAVKRLGSAGTGN